MSGRQGRVKSGVEPLDQLLGGGFACGAVSLLYGEATTGKTTLSLTTALNHLAGHRAAKAVYIDSDNKLNTGRLTQMAEPRGEELLKRLHLHTPLRFSEQEETIEQLPMLDAMDLVVLDSVTGLYRGETGDEAKAYRANKELNRQLGYISEMALKTGAAFLLTGQVRSVLDTSQVEPVAPRLLSYWSSAILKLEKTSEQGKRQATLEKPAVQPNTVNIWITEAGASETPT
ncbi:AAA family ATPase [Candidatus Bathyarchaeota archaeon]|nr:AAA family ATPase [Candidatus Bathyarchaeota archaeon]